VKLGEGRLGVRRVRNGGEEECGEEGRASHPFIGPEGGAGRPDGERDRPAVECAINSIHTFGFWEGKGGGERGVKRGVRRRFWERRGCRGGARACSRRRRWLRRRFLEEEEVGQDPHGIERRGWRRLGRPEAKAQWGGRPVARPREREAAQERRRGVGLWQITRARWKKERRPGRNHFLG
jgi:hypothetical protein